MVKIFMDYGIDGVVLDNQLPSQTPEDQAALIRAVREVDAKNELVVIAQGCNLQGVRTPDEAQLYLASGANAVSLYANIFSKGPFAADEINQALRNQNQN